MPRLAGRRCGAARRRHPCPDPSRQRGYVWIRIGQQCAKVRLGPCWGESGDRLQGVETDLVQRVTQQGDDSLAQLGITGPGQATDQVRPSQAVTPVEGQLEQLRTVRSSRGLEQCAGKLAGRADAVVAFGGSRATELVAQHLVRFRWRAQVCQHAGHIRLGPPARRGEAARQGEWVSLVWVRGPRVRPWVSRGESAPPSALVPAARRRCGIAPCGSHEPVATSSAPSLVFVGHQAIRVTLGVDPQQSMVDAWLRYLPQQALTLPQIGGVPSGGHRESSWQLASHRGRALVPGRHRPLGWGRAHLPALALPDTDAPRHRLDSRHSRRCRRGEGRA